MHYSQSFENKCFVDIQYTNLQTMNIDIIRIDN